MDIRASVVFFPVGAPLCVSPAKTLYLVLLDSGGASDFFSSFPRLLSSSSTVWLIRSSGLHSGSIYLPIDSQIYTFKEVDDVILVNEIYDIDPAMETVVNSYGSWNESRTKRLKLNDLPLFERRRDLMGYTFLAETMPEAPYVTVSYDDEKFIRLGGLWGDIWHGMLEKMLNFSTEIIISPDGQWGSRGENGSWNGIVSRLMKNQTQVGLASFIQTEARMGVVDLSPALTEGSDRMFIKYPGRGTSWTTFIEPFDLYLWLSVICLILLIIMCLFATYCVGVEQKINPGSFVLMNSFVTIWGSQIAQGSHLQPKSISTKLVFCTSFLLGVILLASYSAKLISFLAIVKVNIPFKTLEDVLDSEYKFGSVHGSAPLDSFVQGPDNSVFREIADAIILKDKDNIVDTIEEGLEKTKDENYVFVWTADVIHSITENSCEFLELPIDLYSVSLSIAWSRDVPHRHLVDYYIKKMLETGQMDRIRRIWLRTSDTKCGKGAGFTPMGLENMVSAFAIISISAVISACTCLLETVASKINTG